MSKVLFITAFPPSEVAAAEKNTKLMLKDIGKQYEVDLVYFKDDDVSEYVPELPTIFVKKQVHNSMRYRLTNIACAPIYHPIFTVRFNWALLLYLQRLVDDNNYAAIIFDHSQTFMYARRLKFKGPKLLLSHDVEAQRFERTSSRFMTYLCRKSEGYVLSAHNAIVFSFCQKDVDLIKEYYDIDAHLCLDYIDDRIIESKPEDIKDSFVLFGNWIRPDNYEGALWLLNGIDQYLHTPIQIDIIGKGFPQDKLVGQHKMLKINVLGFVDNPYKTIAECKAMLCPLLSGAGIKVKVIESLASGTPVLGTEIAFEGFSEKYAKFMIRCNSPREFAEQLENLFFPLKERLEFKKMFIADYLSDYIPEWLNRYLN